MSIEYDNKIGQTGDRGGSSSRVLRALRGKGETHWTSHSNVKEREKKRTDGPPRLPAIMSRSRKLAAPSSIMPSSYIVMCDQPDLLFLPASSSSSCSSSSQLVPPSCSANGVSRVADSRSRCKLAGKNKRRDLARPT